MEAYWKQQTRPDGRIFPQCRRTHVQRSILPKHHGPVPQDHENDDPASTAEAVSHHIHHHNNNNNNNCAAGSALVRLGSTHVLAIVTLQVGQITSPGPPRGDVVVSCSPPNPVLQSYLQRLIEETTDLEALAVSQDTTTIGSTITTTTSRSKKLAFRLCCGIQILHDDGNVRDAALLACTAAVSDTTLPDTVWDRDRIWLQTTNAKSRGGRPLPRPCLPVPLTIGIWTDDENGMDRSIVDPNHDEEAALDTRLTVVVDAAAESVPTVVSLECSGEVDMATLALAVKLAEGRGREMFHLLQPLS